MLLDGLIHLRFDFWWGVCQPEGQQPVAEGHGQRLVFVVDDLDRCSPEGIVKTLEAVRLLMDLDNVVAILAIDSRIAMASLALHYNSLSEHHSADPLGIARDYLGKIVHGSLVLQPPTENTVDAYLEEHLWGKDDSEPEPNTPVDKPPATNKDKRAQPESSKPTTQAQPEALLEQPIALDTKPGDLKSDTPELNNDSDDIATDEPKSEPKAEGQESKSLEPEPLESKPLDPKPLPVKEVRLTGLSRAQKDAFKLWVHQFGFRNPRQIKRLNNSYTLVRLTYSQAWSQQTFGIQPEETLLPEHKAEDDSQPDFHRIVMLLWLEYLQELSSQQREPFERLLAENGGYESEDEEKFQSYIEPAHIQHWNRVKQTFPVLQSRQDIYYQVRSSCTARYQPSGGYRVSY